MKRKLWLEDNLRRCVFQRLGDGTLASNVICPIDEIFRELASWALKQNNINIAFVVVDQCWDGMPTFFDGSA